ncbi:MAG: glycosyltransferase family 4 protein [Pelolinea sp.]|nr:glycosyltransferase family 4 protein [Pelolinea sp.]
MNILFITLGIFQDKGGIGKFNQRILRVMDEMLDTEEIESAMALSLWDNQKDLDGKFSKVRVIGFNKKKISNLIAIIRAIAKGHFSYIIFGHVLFFPLFPLRSWLSRSSNQLLIVHGVDVWDKPTKLKRFIVDRFIDRIISVSSQTANRMAESYKLSNLRFLIFQNSIDLGTVDLSISPMPDKNGYRLLSVSRLSKESKHKNIDKTIESLPYILEQFPDLRYIVVGDGSWKSDLKELSKSLGVESSVFFLGELDDKERDIQYNLADVFVLPSTREGFGIVFLEAWKFRLPIVTSNQGAALEVVRDGIDGFCVDPSPQEIAKAVCNLLVDPELRRKMGESGNARLREYFSHEKFRDAFRGLIFKHNP